MARINIAIDGPAGAGKSTIAKMVSKALGIIYLDTGAMYRSVALKAIREGLDPGDAAAVSNLVRDIDISVNYNGNEQRIYLNGEDVSDSIRTPEVSMRASDVAAVPEVRIKLVELQRDIARENDVVMDGRDIGSYVLPDANIKIYLTASVRERAERRYREQLEKGVTGITLEEVMKDIESRDEKDRSRDFAPLKKAEDAIEIDTSAMSVEAVVEKIIMLVRG